MKPGWTGVEILGSYLAAMPLSLALFVFCGLLAWYFGSTAIRTEREEMQRRYKPEPFRDE